MERRRRTRLLFAWSALAALSAQSGALGAGTASAPRTERPAATAAASPSSRSQAPARTSDPQAGARPVPTPDEAVAKLVRQPWSQEPFLPSGEIAAARKVLEAAASREPSNARWAFGLGHAARDESRHATGDAAKAKRKEAKDFMARAAKLDPSRAEHHYWLGTSCFEMIDDVGFLSKTSLASEGRKAYEKAVALDPGYVDAHYALGVYYAQAPAIAGGSTSSAKKEGETMLKLPDGRGEFWGHMLLARIATEEKDWASMGKHYTAAESSRGEGASPIVSLQSHVWNLLNTMKDPAAALPVIARYRAAAKPEDTTPDFFDGEAHRQLGQYKEAVACYERVLASKPEARNTRFGIAECYEKLGNRAAARKHYEEFVRRFPEDEQAAKAREALKRLT